MLVKEKLHDVVAVNIQTGQVRLIATSKTLENAEAIVKMAVIRRGVDEEFFSECKHDAYQEGGIWKGSSYAGNDA